MFYSGDFEEDKKYIEESFGHLCGELRSIDIRDGVRMSFGNKEVIHLRASGNAPELRCYNETDSEQRSIDLNDKCMAIMSEWNKPFLDNLDRSLYDVSEGRMKKENKLSGRSECEF